MDNKKLVDTANNFSITYNDSITKLTKANHQSRIDVGYDISIESIDKNTTITQFKQILSHLYQSINDPTTHYYFWSMRNNGYYSNHVLINYNHNIYMFYDTDNIEIINFLIDNELNTENMMKVLLDDSINSLVKQLLLDYKNSRS